MAGPLTVVSVTLLVLCHGSKRGPSTPFLGAGGSSVGTQLYGWSPHCCVSHAARAMSRQQAWAQHPSSWVLVVLVLGTQLCGWSPHVCVSHAARAMSRQRAWAQHPSSWVLVVLV
jgi:hypothetical protein